MKIYISIPATAKREHADRVMASLSKAGHFPVNPLHNYHGRDATFADRLCNNLRMMCDCDAVYLCQGWQFDTVTRIESGVARELRKEIFYEEIGNTVPEELRFHFS